MSIIGWIVLGLIAGFIASQIVNKQGEGLIMDIVLGIVGAIVGGWLFAIFGHEGGNGFNLYCRRDWCHSGAIAVPRNCWS